MACLGEMLLKPLGGRNEATSAMNPGRISLLTSHFSTVWLVRLACGGSLRWLFLRDCGFLLLPFAQILIRDLRSSTYRLAAFICH